jgi:hypothetical protein
MRGWLRRLWQKGTVAKRIPRLPTCRPTLEVLEERALMSMAPATGWTVAQIPSLGAQNAFLLGVSASSAGDAWAVGRLGNSTLALHWNGTSWTHVMTPSGGGVNQLAGVADVSPTDAFAVGQSGSGPSPLIEQWNGTKWSIVKGAPGVKGVLNAVTAVSATNVWAAGFQVLANGTDQALVEHFDGTFWSVVPTPALPGKSLFFGIAADSSGDVIAVGASGQEESPLVEKLSGNSFTVVSTPHLLEGQLTGVTIISPTDIWAVGNLNSGTLTEHFNGTRWSVVPSPNGSGAENGLGGVAAVSSTEVWAVGSSGSSIPGQTLTEQWNGTSWSVVSSPNPAPFNQLNGVAALATGQVFAVGTLTTASGADQALILQR